MVRAPEDIGLLPDDGLEPAPGRIVRATASTERSYTLSEALHTWRMWLLLMAMFAGTYSLSAHTLVMVPYYKEVGFSSGVAASAMISYGVFSIISRFLWGHISERYNTRYAIVTQALFTACACLVLLQTTQNRASLYVIAGFQGLTLSGFPILVSLVWPEFFGRRHIGSIVGMAQFVVAFANAGAQVISGLIYDHTGTYQTPIMLTVGTWVICAVLMMSLRPSREPAIIPVPVGDSS
jgi:MFS family permease